MISYQFIQASEDTSAFLKNKRKWKTLQFFFFLNNYPSVQIEFPNSVEDKNMYKVTFTK